MRALDKIIDENMAAIENSKIHHEATRRRDEANKPLIDREDQKYAAFAAQGIASYPIESRVINGKTVEVDTLVSKLAPIITRAINFCGGEAESHILAVMCQQVAGELRLSYGSYHLVEIEEACRLGQREEFGEVYGKDGVNAKTIMHWMKGYSKEGYHIRYRDQHMPKIPKLRQPGGIYLANSLESRYKDYIETKLRAQVAAAKAEAAANNEEYVDLPCDNDDGYVEVEKMFRGSNGKRRRSQFHPLWDFDGFRDKEGSNARLLNSLGYPGKDMQDIFEWCIAHGIKTLKDKYGYLKQDAV